MKPSQLTSAHLHPSFLALDRAHLGHASADVLAHLDGCEQCRHYVEIPANTASASGFAAVQQALDKPRRWNGTWLWGSASVAALACSLFLFVTHRNSNSVGSEQAYVGAKGFRSVWIYVKRGSETRLWDGKQPLAFGDRVRLKVDPGGYHHLEVYSFGDPRSPTLLFSGALSPRQNLTLPDAWEIDDSPAAERLFVVFSDSAIKPDWVAWQQGKVPAGVAVLPFVLPKAGAASIDAGSLGP